MDSHGHDPHPAHTPPLDLAIALGLNAMITELRAFRRELENNLLVAQEIRGTQHELLRAVADVHAQNQRIKLLMAKTEQDIIDAINTSTNNLAAAQTATNKTIQDLVNKLAAGTINPDEFATKIQPFLDVQKTIADGLLKTASDNDPVVDPTVPPIEIPTVPTV